MSDAIANCPSCGVRIQGDDRFCGTCGASLPLPPPPVVQAPATLTESPDPAPAEAAAIPERPQRGLTMRASMLGGTAMAVLGLLALLTVTYAARSGAGTGEDDNGSPGEATSIERRVPAGATEVDRSSSFAYAQERPSCSEYVHLTDPAKEMGAEIDRNLRDVTQISAEEEKEFGDRCMESIAEDLGGTLVRDGDTVSYLGAVAKPLLEGVERKDVVYQFYLLRDVEMENAFALPGGHIVVTQPMLDNWLKNEAQLASLLGHEIAHVDLRHPLAVMQYLKALGLDDDAMVERMVLSLAKVPYSSNLEETSDKAGARFAHQSGYSLFQAVELWQSIADKKKEGSPAPTEGSDLFGVLLNTVVTEVEHLVSSHPDSARRACLLRQVAHDLYQEDPLEQAYVGRTNYRRKKSMGQQVF